MKTLQIGVANTVEYYRTSSAITCTKVEYYDVLDGTLLATDSSPTNDATDLTVSVAAADGDATITLSGTLAAGYKYEVGPETAGEFPPFVIDVISINTDDVAELKYELTREIAASATVKGIRVTSTYTPADSTYRAVRAVFTLSNGKVEQEEYLLFKRFVRCPIAALDVIQRWSRIINKEPAWQRRTGQSWQPQIDEAWERVVDDLYVRNIMVDTIINPGILKELVFTHFDRILTEMGIDAVAGDNRLERLKMLERKVDTEMQRVMSAPLALDKDEDNQMDNEELRPLSLNWDQPRSSWRYR